MQQNTNVVFKLEVDERKKKKAMKTVCRFSGVTSLNVMEEGKLTVTGEFDNYEMTKKLKKICKHIAIIAAQPIREPEQNRNPFTRREPNREPEQNRARVTRREPSREPEPNRAPLARRESRPRAHSRPSIPHARPSRVRGENSDGCIIM
ncbi:Heavy metal-associated isoprenylated plant protein 11 [Arabidopsis thaliana]|uniref:HMA domain-containing protein n=3 Tax=Arabidopsis TaxID=3701 RepID=A0A5S9YDP2_ARATH|nr:hypothetical protein ISN45_At05g048230 [Arabidopsis thaliana x Arabidopsis arenosa]CAA0409399.1 unnamed protein product [Arabidopsis thaliana]